MQTRVEVRKVGSAALMEARQMAEEAGCPLRAPHHSVSQAGLIGELALSAGGILLLDCVEEFRGSSLTSLRNHIEMMARDAKPTLFITYGGDELDSVVKNALRVGDSGEPEPRWDPEPEHDVARQKVLDAGIDHNDCEVDGACEVSREKGEGAGAWVQVWIYLRPGELP